MPELPSSPPIKNTSAERNVPSGHCFSTSKQSNYQCHYLHSIVMELMLWQIVRNASFHGLSYSKSCVSSECLSSPSAAPALCFLLFASKVTRLLLFQPISCCTSHMLLLLEPYFIVSCILQHIIGSLKAQAFAVSADQPQVMAPITHYGSREYEQWGR